jgi:hypothetical protein
MVLSSLKKKKHSVAQLLKKFPAIYGTRRLITMFTRTRLWFLSWARWLQSTPLYSFSFLPSMTRSYEWSLPLRLSKQNFVRISHVSRARYTHRPCYSCVGVNKTDTVWERGAECRAMTREEQANTAHWWPPFTILPSTKPYENSEPKYTLVCVSFGTLLVTNMGLVTLYPGDHQHWPWSRFRYRIDSR